MGFQFHESFVKIAIFSNMVCLPIISSMPSYDSFACMIGFINLKPSSRKHYEAGQAMFSLR